MRHTFIGIIIVLVGIAFGGLLAGPATNLKRPNIIIILSDDQGWGDFSIHRNRNVHTPNLDQLALHGAQFENFYVQPVCSPTRAELLTGRYSPRTGVYSTSTGGERLDLDETTLPQLFSKAGYATAAYGKWHNGMQYPYHPIGRGFDEFYGFCSGHWGNYFNPMLEHNGKIIEGEGFVINDFTQHGLSFIEKHQDQPFLLYLAYNTPHAPMQVPDQWWNRLENRPIEMRAEESGKEDTTFTQAALAMCENIDWNVGLIVQKLEYLNLDEETIVLFFNDNGPNSPRWNGGMRGRKGSTDEGGVRSPLFIKWPGQITAGKKINQIAGVIDILPTLLDLANVTPDTRKSVDGLSLKPLLLGENSRWNNRLIYNSWKNRISVRSQKFRLDHEGNLYNVELDRGQKREIGNQYPKIKEQLTKAQNKYREEVLSELPGQESRPFPLGHPEFKYTQIPARDGVSHGQIKRSNRSPNCSYFTNWTSIKDSITWDVEVLHAGDFQVTLYYTCPTGDEGSDIIMTHGKNQLLGSIRDAYNPPLFGMDEDRALRKNSY
ncbi:MAG: arylsulfatase, partial [Saprospiraceae bacterium]|nr:arylsulfatase [Saprospiraceae bacterium]